MKIKFKKLNKAYNKKPIVQILADDEIEEKVLNENDIHLHTMLMKADFENYLEANKSLLSSFEQEYQADLTDFKLYEKELIRRSGNKKR